MEDERQAGDGEENPMSPKPTKWTPNQHHLKILLGMGINRNAAIKALYYTGNQGPDFAAQWIFENNDEDIDGPLDLEASDESDTEDEDAPETYKMVFAVNTELEMSTGKIAAQVGHAVLGLYRLLLQDETKYGNMLLLWEEYGETKIALRANSTQHLLDLDKKATELGLPTYLVQDAGRTQIPAGSTTVVGIMGRNDLVDQVTGGLRLL
ncbi:probable peptidyl-tRNA hydrolase 2 [Dermacentor albipictus]|uniref:probable peptidyl-tRNA hydrolase 2 n=1 Tax=Dermacentor albipictus TaxID=60249 RepID=UPI0038FD19FB